MQTIADLKNNFPRPGRVEWIGRAAERRGPVESVPAVLLRPGTGLEGEHHAVRGASKRQVTLIQAEHLPAIASLAGLGEVRPEQLRRNIVVSGINLSALKDCQFRIGPALLEGTGPCAPCSRMEEVLGPGGYNAMRGHGGLTARVLVGGEIRVGDPVEFVSGALSDDEKAEIASEA